MDTAVLAGGAGNVRNGAPRVHNEGEFLRGRPDVKPRGVVPVGKEVVVEPHVSLGRAVGAHQPPPLPVAAEVFGREPGRIGIGLVKREEPRTRGRRPMIPVYVPKVRLDAACRPAAH